MVTKPSSCQCKCMNSQLNAKLLQYFFENENRIRQSASAASDRETLASEKKVSSDINFGVSSKKVADLNESANFDNFDKSSCKSSLKSSKNTTEHTKEPSSLDTPKEERSMAVNDLSND